MTAPRAPHRSSATLPGLDNLMRQIEQALAGPARSLRVEIPAPRMSGLAWLETQRAAVKTYWCDRDREFIMVGVGAADLVIEEAAGDWGGLFRYLHDTLNEQPGFRYYGGFRFDAEAPPDTRWSRLGACRFVVPRFEYVETPEAAMFACNVVRRADQPASELLTAIRQELAALRFPGASAAQDLPTVLSRTDRPDQPGWNERVTATLRAIEQRRFEKVVLARESLFGLAERMNPASLLRRVKAAVEHTYLFLFQPEDGLAFVGASPERLWKRMGRMVESEALAGTRPRGASQETDWALGDRLLHDDKELREHRFVRDAIQAAFGNLCQDLHGDPDVSLVRLRDCQHLVCRFEGLLADDHTDADLLRAFHPTPAVGGFPTANALEWIRDREPFDRGWYAGPVGWIGHDASEFAVGIRSALIEGASVCLYAGAGLVLGSTPEQEWNEIEGKIHTFLKGIGGHDD